jgi:hypothetical protein
MEQMPEIQDSQLTVTINRRYQGDFEVSISYAGQYLKRYPLQYLFATFLQSFLRNFPILGMWLFSREARARTITSSYARAVNDCISRIKMDVANSIFDQGAPDDNR